jgi:hypothetical protein
MTIAIPMIAALFIYAMVKEQPYIAALCVVLAVAVSSI